MKTILLQPLLMLSMFIFPFPTFSQIMFERQAFYQERFAFTDRNTNEVINAYRLVSIDKLPADSIGTKEITYDDVPVYLDSIVIDNKDANDLYQSALKYFEFQFKEINRNCFIQPRDENKIERKIVNRIQIDVEPNRKWILNCEEILNCVDGMVKIRMHSFFVYKNAKWKSRSIYGGIGSRKALKEASKGCQILSDSLKD